MSDTATASVDRILKGDEYTVIPNVPVFDEHEEKDGDDEPVRKFDRVALQKIADKCNQRAKESGDLSPIGPGHTIPDAPQHKQPPTYGYAANYKVGTFGPGKKLGVLCDFYVKKTVTTPDGKEADGLKEVKSYPRRSIELWLKDGFIDHIALLRSAPQRDIGLLEYSKTKSKFVKIPSQNNLFSEGRSLAAAVRGGKLCYSMEHAMPLDNVPAMGDDKGQNDQNQDPNAVDENSPEHQEFVKHAEHYMKTKRPKCYAMDAAPSGSNTFVPGDEDDDKDRQDPTLPPKADEDEIKRMSRDFAGADEKVKVAQFSRLLKAVYQLQQDREDERKQASLDDAKARYDRLVAQGFVLKEKEVVSRFSKMPTKSERDSYEAELMETSKQDLFRYASSTPVPAGMLDLEGRRAGKKSYSREQSQKAVDIATRDGITYEQALEQVAK